MSELSGLTRVLLENLDNALFELSEKATTDHQHHLYFETMRETRLKHNAILKSFNARMEFYFDRFLNRATSGAENVELALMPLDEIENQLFIDTMLLKTRSNSKDNLHAITERLKATLGLSTAVEDDNPLDLHPFDPQAIFDSFHSAISLVDVNMSTKQIFYQLFDKYVICNLDGFYTQVNQLFISEGILPSFELTPLKDSASPLSSAIPTLSNNIPLDNGTLISMAQNSAYISDLTKLQATAIQRQPLDRVNSEDVRAAMQQSLLRFIQENSQQISTVENQVINLVSKLFDYFFDDALLAPTIKVVIGQLQIPVLKIAILDNRFFYGKAHPASQLLEAISNVPADRLEGQHGKLLINKIGQITNQLLVDFEQDIAVFDDALTSFEQILSEDSQRIKQKQEALRQQHRDRDQKIKVAQSTVAALIAKLIASHNLNVEMTAFFATTWTSVLVNIYLKMGAASSQWKNIKRISSILIWTLTPKFTEQERLKMLMSLPSLLRAISQAMVLVKIDSEVQNDVFQTITREHSSIVKQTSKNIALQDHHKSIAPPKHDDTHQVKTPKKQSMDTIELIVAAPINDVIQDMEDFTADAKNSVIDTTEEIVIESLEHKEAHTQPEIVIDRYFQQAKNLEIGAWVEFKDANDKTLLGRVTWKSNLTGKLVFSNQQGDKVKSVTTYGLAIELRAGRARPVQIKLPSPLDRTLSSFITSLKH